jgi:hypothetical protein
MTPYYVFEKPSLEGSFSLSFYERIVRRAPLSPLSFTSFYNGVFRKAILIRHFLPEGEKSRSSANSP